MGTFLFVLNIENDNRVSKIGIFLFSKTLLIRYSVYRYLEILDFNPIKYIA